MECIELEWNDLIGAMLDGMFSEKYMKECQIDILAGKVYTKVRQLDKSMEPR